MFDDNATQLEGGLDLIEAGELDELFELEDDESTLIHHPLLGPGRRTAREDEADLETSDKVVVHPRLGRGRAVPRSAELEEPTAGELEILGADDRVRVTNTTAVPFRWICALDLFFADPDDPSEDQMFRGSGTLIGPRHILTAGHNLFDEIQGSKGTRRRQQVRRLVAAPGRNGRTRPFGSTTGQVFRTATRWRSALDSQFDFGLVILRDSIGTRQFRSLGNRPLGFWGSRSDGAGTRINPKDPKFLRGIKVNISGYPGDKCLGRPRRGTATDAQIAVCPTADWASTQWRAFDRVLDPAPASALRKIQYAMDTFGGHSGSPVWLRWKQFRNLIAIHTTGSSSGGFNAGTRITAEVMRTVRSWM